VKLILFEFKLLLWVVCLVVRVVTNNILPFGVGSVEVVGGVTISVCNLNLETSGGVSSSNIVFPINANMTSQVVIVKVNVFGDIAFRASNSNCLCTGISAWALIVSCTN